MSWDVLLMRLPADVTSVHEIPTDYTPDPLGRRDDIRAAVTQTCPEADLSDPAWGELSGPTWSVELNIGSEDPVDSIMLHIRGSGGDVLTDVFRLAEALRCKMLDCANGDLNPWAYVGLGGIPGVRGSSARTLSVIPPGRSTSIRPMHPESRSSLDGLLPPGRMVTSDEGDGDRQPLWLTDRFRMS